MKQTKIIYVDIDETICFYDGERQYALAIPNKTNISKINKLYDEGNRIVYWTARGSRSGIDWTALTKQQLNQWGAKYHELYCDKPYYDIFVEDKSIRIEEL
jgi:hypothetical protein